MGTEVQCGSCGEVTLVPMSRLASGVVIARDFLILEELGRGGMGVVYLAHQLSLDRPAAVKILTDVYANDSEFIVGFIKEARAAAKLNHPHIVQAYAVGEDEGIYFFAMERVDGETMKSVLQREKKVPIERATTIMQQISEALDYAWKEQRLIHRDIKPDNIMITSNGRAKLADLGLARVEGEIDDSEEDEVMGTPQYISPEHLTGAPMDVRSDIYSLGATYYNIITGEFPFTGKTALEIARKHLEVPLVPPHKEHPEVPREVSAVICMMMEKDPDSRYQSAEELVEDLRRVRRGRAPRHAKMVGAPSGGGGGKTLILNKSRTGTGSISTGTGAVRTSSTQVGASTQTGTATGTSSSLDLKAIREIQEKRAMKQIIIWVTVASVITVLGISFAVWRHVSQDDEAPEEKEVVKDGAGTLQIPKETIQIGDKEPEPEPEPETTPYTEEVSEIVAFAQTNPERKLDILLNCDKFFKKHPRPVYKVEKEALSTLLPIYVPLDEEMRIIEAREKLRRKHEEVLARRRLEEQEKLSEIERKKREAQREEERKRLEEMKAAREKERLAEYKNYVELTRESMMLRYLEYIRRNNYPGASDIFSDAVSAKNRAEGILKDEALAFASWGEKMQSHVEAAEKVADELQNGTTEANGLSLELGPGAYGEITSVKNSAVTVKIFSNQEVTRKVNDIPASQLVKLIAKIAPENGFHYFTANTYFKEAKEMAPREWLDQISEIAFAFLKQNIKSIIKLEPEKRQLEYRRLYGKYGRLKEFNEAKKAVIP